MLSFTSDWLYPTYQSLETVSALRSRNIDVAFCELNSNYGHDAFLVEAKEQSEMIAGFLDSVYRGQKQGRPAEHAAPPPASSPVRLRPDYAMIAEIVEPGSRRA